MDTAFLRYDNDKIVDEGYTLRTRHVGIFKCHTFPILNTMSKVTHHSRFQETAGKGGL